MDKLYINNQEVEFGEEVNVYLTYRSNIMGDMSKIFGNNSTTIRIPATSHNQELIDYANILITQTTFPKLKHKAKVERDGVVIIDNATVILLGADEQGFEVALTWGASESIRQLAEAEDELPKLAVLGEEAPIWTYPDYPNAGTELFPEASYGFSRRKGAGDEQKPYGYHPVLNVGVILSRIETYYGITFTMSERSRVTLERLYMPILRSDTPSETSVSEQTIDKQYNPSIIDNRQRFVWNNVTNPLRPSTAYRVATTVTGVIADVRLKIYCPSPNAEALITDCAVLSLIKINKSRDQFDPIIEIPCTSVSYINGVDWNVIFNYSTTEELGTRGEDDYADWFLVNKAQGDTLYMTYIYAGSVVKVSERLTDIKIGDKYYLWRNLPQLKIIDFIKAATQMFGMYASTSEGNTIKLCDYNDMLNPNRAVDWSERYVRGQEKVSFSDNSVFYRKNHVTYKDNDAQTAMNTYFSIEDESLEKEGDYISLPFSATRYISDQIRDGMVGIPLYTERYEYEADEEGASVEKDIVEKTGDDKRAYVAFMDKYTNLGKEGYYLHRRQLGWSSLLNNYYPKVIKSVQDMKYITATFLLSAVDIKDIDMSRMVYLEQYASYFAIIEIKTKANNLAEVKLLKLV